MALSDIIKKYECWFRLSLLLHEVLRVALYNILHNVYNNKSYAGLPTDPTQLYNHLYTHYHKKFNTLYKKNKVIGKSEFELIFPSNQKTDSTLFDVTLLAILIRNCLVSLPAPKADWTKPPKINDTSIAADVIRCREWRNFVHHTEPGQIDQNTFNSKWTDAIAIVTRLGYKGDINIYKTAMLDVGNSSVLNSLISLLNIRLVKLDQRLVQLQSDVLNNQNKIDQNEARLDKADETMKDLKNEINTVQEDLKKCIECKQQCLQNKIDVEKLDERINLVFTNFDFMYEKIDQFTERLEDVENMCNDNAAKDEVPWEDRITKSVINVLCDEIGDHWYDLAKALGLKDKKMKNLHEDDMKLDADKMKECFAMLLHHVSWTNLQHELQTLGLHSIIHLLQRSTLMTNKLANASSQLKTMYLKELMQVMMAEGLPLNGADDHSTSYVQREESYIDLAILKSSDVDKDWSKNDRDYLMKTRYLERQGIKLDEILTRQDSFVTVRGIAGIGKSTMTEALTLKWANNKSLNGDNDSSKIDFLFKFTCRDLNTLQDIETENDLLIQLYPDVFNKISLTDLKEISDRVLFIVDGLDELQDIDYLATDQEITPQNVKVVYNLLNCKWKGLPSHKTIAVGRPNSCSLVKCTFLNEFPIKSVEICGFTRLNVNKYIEYYFKNDKRLAFIVQQKISESQNLLAMSTIPIYTWVICAMFKSDQTVRSPKTTTELCTYSLLVFIRNHLYLSRKQSFVTLSDLIKDEKLLRLIFALSKLSKVTLENKKVIFTDTDIRNLHLQSDLKVETLIEKTGFIYESPKSGSEKSYQFRHLVLQEYLASLYLVMRQDKLRKSFENPNLSSCFTMVCGLFGNRMSAKSENIPKKFLTNLCKQNRRTSFRRDPVGINEIMTERLKACIHESKLIVDRKCHDVLCAINEFQEELPSMLMSTISKIQEIAIKSMFYQHEIMNFFFFIHRIESVNIDSIHIVNNNNEKLPNDIIHLLSLYFKPSERSEQKHTVHFVKKNEMTITTNLHMEDIDPNDTYMSIYDIPKHVHPENKIEKENDSTQETSSNEDASIYEDLQDFQEGGNDDIYTESPYLSNYLAILQKQSNEKVLFISLPDEESVKNHYQMLNFIFNGNKNLVDQIVFHSSLDYIYLHLKPFVESCDKEILYVNETSYTSHSEHTVTLSTAEFLIDAQADMLYPPITFKRGYSIGDDVGVIMINGSISEFILYLDDGEYNSLEQRFIDKEDDFLKIFNLCSKVTLDTSLAEFYPLVREFLGKHGVNYDIGMLPEDPYQHLYEVSLQITINTLQMVIDKDILFEKVLVDYTTDKISITINANNGYEPIKYMFTLTTDDNRKAYPLLLKLFQKAPNVTLDIDLKQSSSLLQLFIQSGAVPNDVITWLPRYGDQNNLINDKQINGIYVNLYVSETLGTLLHIKKCNEVIPIFKSEYSEYELISTGPHKISDKIKILKHFDNVRIHLPRKDYAKLKEELEQFQLPTTNIRSTFQEIHGLEILPLACLSLAEIIHDDIEGEEFTLINHNQEYYLHTTSNHLHLTNFQTHSKAYVSLIQILYHKCNKCLIDLSLENSLQFLQVFSYEKVLPDLLIVCPTNEYREQQMIDASTLGKGVSFLCIEEDSVRFQLRKGCQKELSMKQKHQNLSINTTWRTSLFSTTRIFEKHLPTIEEIFSFFPNIITNHIFDFYYPNVSALCTNRITVCDRTPLSIVVNFLVTGGCFWKVEITMENENLLINCIEIDRKAQLKVNVNKEILTCKPSVLELLFENSSEIVFDYSLDQSYLYVTHMLSDKKENLKFSGYEDMISLKSFKVSLGQAKMLIDAGLADSKLHITALGHNKQLFCVQDLNGKRSFLWSKLASEFLTSIAIDIFDSVTME